MDVLCELYPVEMTAIFASKRIFAAAATGGARTAELPIYVGECVYVCVYPSERIHVVACGPIGTKFGTHMQIHLQMVVG